MLINPPHANIVGWILKFLEDCGVYEAAIVLEVVVKVLNRAGVTFPVVAQSVTRVVLFEGSCQVSKSAPNCMNLI